MSSLYFQSINFKNFIYLFLLFRAAPAAYGGSQARGRIRVIAIVLCLSRSNTGSEPHLWLTTQLMATPELNPWSEARDQIHILMDVRFVNLWTTERIPMNLIFLEQFLGSQQSTKSSHKTSRLHTHSHPHNWHPAAQATVSDPTLIRHHHPTSIVYIEVRSCCRSICGF